MKVGLNQFNKPTPQRITILFDFLVGACSIISGSITAASFISHKVSDLITWAISTLLIPILLLAKRCFGSETTQTKIPIEDVAVIKDHEEK